MPIELTRDVTQGEVGWGMEFTFLLCSHCLCTFVHMVPSETAQLEAVQGNPSPLAQTSEYCPYAMSPPQHSSWMLFSPCSTSKGWIPTFNKENAVLLCQHPTPSPITTPTPKSHFLVVSHLAAPSVVLKQKHVSCHK